MHSVVLLFSSPFFRGVSVTLLRSDYAYSACTPSGFSWGAVSIFAGFCQGQPICMTGVQLHILTNGAAFDLKTRVATPPPRKEPA